MFVAVLFAIPKIWKQPECSVMGEWIEKMWYKYTMEYYSAIKRINNATCSNVDESGECPTD